MDPGAAVVLAAAGTAAPTPGGHGTGIADDIVAITLAPEIADLMEQRIFAHLPVQVTYRAAQ